MSEQTQEYAGTLNHLASRLALELVIPMVLSVEFLFACLTLVCMGVFGGLGGLHRSVYEGQSIPCKS